MGDRARGGLEEVTDGSQVLAGSCSGYAAMQEDSRTAVERKAVRQVPKSSMSRGGQEASIVTRKKGSLSLWEQAPEDARGVAMNLGLVQSCTCSPAAGLCEAFPVRPAPHPLSSLGKQTATSGKALSRTPTAF